MRAQRILVTGAQGMLGQDLVAVLQQRGHAVVALGRVDLDVTDAASVAAAFEAARPTMVVHAAAYTRVDDAEAAPEDAWRVNAEGARLVALASRRHGAPMLFVSTDYVFDGGATRPYPVDAPTAPLNAYGRSKLAGERAVREALEAHYIVRTSWLYGQGGPNFVATMRRLARQQPVLRVVADQVGSPTWTVPLAEAIAALLASGRYGTYHATGTGQASWHEFASRIMALDGLDVPVEPVPTEAFPRPAQRPAYSVLDGRSLALAGVAPLPPWEESLAAYLATHPWEATAPR